MKFGRWVDFSLKMTQLNFGDLWEPRKKLYKHFNFHTFNTGLMGNRTFFSFVLNCTTLMASTFLKLGRVTVKKLTNNLSV